MAFKENAASLGGKSGGQGSGASKRPQDPHPHPTHVQRPHSCSHTARRRAGGPRVLLQPKVTPVPHPQAPAAQHILITACQGHPGRWVQWPEGVSADLGAEKPTGAPCGSRREGGRWPGGRPAPASQPACPPPPSPGRQRPRQGLCLHPSCSEAPADIHAGRVGCLSSCARGLATPHPRSDPRPPRTSSSHCVPHSSRRLDTGSSPPLTPWPACAPAPCVQKGESCHLILCAKHCQESFRKHCSI